MSVYEATNAFAFYHSQSIYREYKEQFDIIVSNPPYVRNLEKETIKKNVLDYEPHLALFVEDDDALIFYRKIIELALKNLSDLGQLYFEINQYLGTEMVDLLRNQGFQNVALRKDIYGNDRMTRAIRTSKLQLDLMQLLSWRDKYLRLVQLQNK
jgi:methylase of polypeptide subunit release factors